MARPRHPHRRPERYVLECGLCGYTLAGKQLQQTLREYEKRHLMPAHDTTFAVLEKTDTVTFVIRDTWTDRRLN